MRVNNSYHAHVFALNVAYPFIADYVVSYGVSDAFRTRRIAALKNYTVEILQQNLGNETPILLMSCSILLVVSFGVT